MAEKESKPRYRLTDKGLKQVEKYLLKTYWRNGKVNQSSVSNDTGLDRATIGKIVNKKPVNLGSLKGFFDFLGIALIYRNPTGEIERYQDRNITNEEQLKKQNIHYTQSNFDCEEIFDAVEKKPGFLEVQGWEEIDIEEVESATQNTRKWRLVVEGDIENLTQEEYERLRDCIRKLAEDGTQKVIKISRGSIILEFEGSPEGFERIKALFESGELTEIAGFAIQEISALPEQQTQRTQLSQWLQGVFAPLWESVDGLFATGQPSFAFRQRSEGISRRKTIILNEFEDRQVELVATIIPLERPKVKVIVQILPSPESSHLPEDLRIKLLDESDADNPEGQVFDAKENLEFNVEEGDAFSIIVEQGRYRVVERFMV